MNDITALAQAEINDALAQLKQLSEYPTPSTQYARVLRKYIASLVEALEKEIAMREQNLAIKLHMSDRIAELESRTVTVKLPAYPEPSDSLMRASMKAVRTMDVEALRAAGINVEAE